MSSDGLRSEVSASCARRRRRLWRRRRLMRRRRSRRERRTPRLGVLTTAPRLGVLTTAPKLGVLCYISAAHGLRTRDVERLLHAGL
jgi:hypothetical protein